MRMDCLMWLQFLTGETTTAINRSFVDFQSNSITAQELDFHSDVSGAKYLGMGAIFENSWMFQMWVPLSSKFISQVLSS